MATPCSGVTIPEVDETALPCDGLVISTDCITTTKAYNFFGISIGEYLTNVFTKITDKVKLISNLVNINTQAISDETTRATAAELALSSGSVLTTKVTLTSANIKNLNSTPITLLAAPGTGKYYDVQSITIRNRFNTTAYNASLDILAIWFSQGADSIYEISGAIKQLGTYAHALVRKAPVVDDIQIEEDDSILISAASNSTVGDGEIDIYITYKIITL